jgi:ABC-type glycerol-3-phosphate transport system substrate-binding protein
MHRVSQLSPKGDAARAATPQAGKVALWFNWLPNYLLYRTQVGNQLQFTYGVVPPPAAPKTKKSVFIVNAPGWGVVKESKNQEEAWALLRQLVTPESMRRTYLEAASPPARKSLSNSRDFWKAHPDLPSPDVMMELAEARSKHTRGLPRLSNFADMQTVLAEEFGAAWADKQSVRDAALKVSQRTAQLLKDGEVDK